MHRIPTIRHKRANAARRNTMVLSAGALALIAAPASARDLSPEFSSRVWVENGTEVASVCMNGKELLTFKGAASNGNAAEEAEDLAGKLDELVSTKNFDVNQLLPARDGDKAAIRLSGATAVSFAPLAGKNTASNCFDSSLKLVNGIRIGMGAQPLPAKLADLSKTALANAGKTFSGKASWYGPKFHGRRTSDGHRFDMDGMTAAHRSLPFGTKLLVLNRRTGDSCIVEVNDRGPFIGNRVLDLSRGAARRLNMIGSGVAMVDCLVLQPSGGTN